MIVKESATLDHAYNEYAPRTATNYHGTVFVSMHLSYHCERSKLKTKTDGHFSMYDSYTSTVGQYGTYPLACMIVIPLYGR